MRPGLIGQPVAGYRVERVLGRGGSGSVYLAHADGRAVALKVMHEHDRSGVGRKRFEREAALVKKLRHPNIVELYDYGHTEDGLPYIVFEVLEGRSLKEALGDGPFGDARAGRIALSVIEALIAAHGMGIIHRDIKPGNIFLREGGGEEVQVLDFGLAKAIVGDQIETATLTRTGYRLGTPRYMSPEMARGMPVVEGSDLYSLGLVLAEMVAGRPVLEGDMHVGIMLEHGSDEPLPLPEAVEASPLAPVIARALDKDLEQRFRNAASMRDALVEALTRCLPELPPVAAASQPAADIVTPIAAPRPPEVTSSLPAPAPSVRPVLQGDGPTLLLTTPEDPAFGEATTRRMPKRGDDQSLTELKGQPEADASTQLWMGTDDPTRQLHRPLPPSRPPRSLPPVEPWQAVAVGVLLALTLFALGVALVR